MLANKLLSGLEIQQNRASASTALPTTGIYQSFYLPENIERGTDASEIRIPPVTGFSILVGVDAGDVEVLGFDWKVERYMFGAGWNTLDSGTYFGAPHSGDRVWLDVYCKDLITVDPEALSDTWRIVLYGRPSGGVVRVPVTYTSKSFTMNGIRTLVTGKITKTAPFLFTHAGIPSVLHYDNNDGKMYFSNQQNPSQIWYGTYSSSSTMIDARHLDETDVITSSTKTPLTFRILTASGDDGRDFLGNIYRHSIFQHGVENTSTTDGTVIDRHWLSKPNPSRFAVESLYYDLSSNGGPGVFDAILLDPITPDMYFHVYYTDEGDPGTTPEEWDEKLWKRVPRTFQAKRRDSYAMPEPVRARYVKVEFTHLQPRPYKAGTFEQPIRYKKHPKWVMDYYLLRIEEKLANEGVGVARRVNMQFDALDIAYNYYLDDLRQEPNAPVTYTPSRAVALQRFMTDRTSASDRVDADLLSRINLSLRPFRDGVSGQADHQSLLGSFIINSTPVPVAEDEYDFSRAYLSEVSTLNRDQVVLEQSFPVTSFYLTSRHHYRELQARFTHERAYFAGVREVNFLREKYTNATDTNLYVEIGGDSVNIELNDFVHDDNALVIRDA